LRVLKFSFYILLSLVLGPILSLSLWLWLAIFNASYLYIKIHITGDHLNTYKRAVIKTCKKQCFQRSQWQCTNAHGPKCQKIIILVTKIVVYILFLLPLLLFGPFPYMASLLLGFGENWFIVRSGIRRRPKPQNGGLGYLLRYLLQTSPLHGWPWQQPGCRRHDLYFKLTHLQVPEIELVIDIVNYIIENLRFFCRGCPKCSDNNHKTTTTYRASGFEPNIWEFHQTLNHKNNHVLQCVRPNKMGVFISVYATPWKHVSWVKI
jgi:hypothetical protein